MTLKHEANVKDISEKVFDMISKQRFADWYNDGGRFDEYICDPNESGITKEDILNDIKNMLNL